MGQAGARLEADLPAPVFGSAIALIPTSAAALLTASRP